MGKDRPGLELTPERLEMICYITDEGAAFSQEIAQYTRRWFTDVDDDLQYLVDHGVVDRVPSNFFPDIRTADIFQASEKAHEVRQDFERKT